MLGEKSFIISIGRKLRKLMAKYKIAKLPEFYPYAGMMLSPSSNLVGYFAKRDPSGITVHYTASRSLEATHETLMIRGLNYHFIIERDGMIVQTAKLTHRVHHAGKASWQNRSPNRSHISIALLSWGLLDEDGKNWTGGQVHGADWRRQGGALWDKATEPQEESLIKLCKWLVKRGIPSKGICGHDECCIPPGRKVDPGGITSFTMEELRQTCKEEA